jgi:hypothetical protein
MVAQRQTIMIHDLLSSDNSSPAVSDLIRHQIFVHGLARNVKQREK